MHIPNAELLGGTVLFLGGDGCDNDRAVTKPLPQCFNHGVPSVVKSY